MKGKSDQAQVRAFIKTYLETETTAKQAHFSALIAFADKVTGSLLSDDHIPLVRS